MTITFTIEYKTNWGEGIRITGSVPELGENNPERSYPMSTADGINWTASIEINVPPSGTLNYNYCFFDKGNFVKKEWSYCPRTLALSSLKENYIVKDAWRNTPEQQFLYSSAFEDCLFLRKPSSATNFQGSNLILKTLVPAVQADYAIGISGNHETLGNWDPEKVYLLNDSNYPEWSMGLTIHDLTTPLEYKYVLYNLNEKKIIQWENRDNRTLLLNSATQENEITIHTDEGINFSFPVWKYAGVIMPIFSLRSEKSFGIGDFGDLKKLIDWAILTNQKIIQILPINDTTMDHTWTDSYPYNTISIYALHPIYMDITQLGTITEIETSAYFAESQQKLNASPFMDYEEANRVKWEFFRNIYKQEGNATFNTPSYKDFFEKNQEWLKPYAVFSYLRDIYKTPDFRHWPKYTNYNRDEIEALTHPDNPEFDGVGIYFYLQYHLHSQLLAASSYARENGIILKGDIPIGISRNSVEAWIEPHYFNLNGQAGAPPDAFAVNGQNWGFPTYNWDVMEKDGYQWWRKRFTKLAEYFDAYRIDHILGFMRIWEIPIEAVHGLLGQFVPALPLSKEEIEAHGLPFDEDLFLSPYIHDTILSTLFGENAQKIKDTFLEPRPEEGRYKFRKEFNTQRKIESWFVDKTDIENVLTRDNLYSLVSNVLFLRDHRVADKYHPRITVQNDFIFQLLSQEHKEAFNQLYNDFYYHRHNEFWYQQAMKKLPQLTHSNRMLVCGEDLGMIPESLKYVMNDLQILTLEIQRMPKEYGVQFGDPARYPYRSVCTISTHDMSTLRGWWKENPEQTQTYFNTTLKRDGTAPTDASGDICTQVVQQHLAGKSLLCILAWQDWMSIDEQWRNPDIEAERINIPANPKHYWRYRMHLTLEELIKAESVNNRIIELINETERYSN